MKIFSRGGEGSGPHRTSFEYAHAKQAARIPESLNDTPT